MFLCRSLNRNTKCENLWLGHLIRKTLGLETAR